MSDEQPKKEPGKGNDQASDKGAKSTPPKATPRNSPALGDILINPKAPMDHCGNGPAMAFHAGHKNKGGTGMAAIVCEKHYSPRVKDAETYQGIVNPNCAKLRNRGVVYWPPAKQERYVIVYEASFGKPLVRDKDELALGMKQDKVIDCVVKPFVNLMMDFRDRSFVHGSIRANNIYDGGQPDFKNVVLGDGLSVPASSTQSVLYETIPRGMADPLGRGVGTIADDLYALGVTVGVMMRVHDPLKGMSDEQIIKHKIEHGSYATVTGKDRFTGSILELLRGLLHDEVDQRWSIDDVALWMDGHRLSPKQTTKAKKAMRPIQFSGQNYFQLSELAMDLDGNAMEATKIAEDGSLMQWVERSVEDSDALNRLGKSYVAAVSKGRGADFNERVVSFLSMALDPMAPIRYCGLKLRGGGIGPALSRAVVLKQEVKPFVDLFVKDIVTKWLAVHQSANIDVAMLMKKYDSCKRALMQGTMGHGIERCVYILNDQAHCCSDKLSEYHVTKPEDLLAAIETMCTKNELEGLILDRHMVAFLSHNDSRVVDPYLFDLNSSEYHQNILGNLKCFAAMQDRYAVGPMPGVSRVIHDMLPAVFKRFHDREVREKIRESAKRYMKAGDLVKMSAALSNPATNKKDYQAFLLAMKEYAQLQKEHETLETALKESKTFGRATGQDVSAIFSSVVALLVILAVAYSYLSGGMGF